MCVCVYIECTHENAIIGVNLSRDAFVFIVGVISRVQVCLFICMCASGALVCVQIQKEKGKKVTLSRLKV